jgi:hypothetical protein
MPKGEIVGRLERFLVVSMNADDSPMGEYCRYVTFVTEFFIDVNIEVFCGI